MKVLITQSSTSEVASRFGFVQTSGEQFDLFFNNRFYGEDLKHLFMGFSCHNPKFEGLIKAPKPSYNKDIKVVKVSGREYTLEAGTLMYTTILDFNAYFHSDNPSSLLAKDLLDSLEIIRTIKKIKDFDFERFKSDLELFFKENKWM